MIIMGRKICKSTKKKKNQSRQAQQRWKQVSLDNEGDGFVELKGLNRLYEANVTCYHGDVVHPPHPSTD